ncbi:MAG: type II toxin-antitoxin system VapC family toxin [Thermodesulfobacteriota bacterium]|nr:type II toxin-antitoxin system VapC family toxin [Thermodesulfobacteriota bacterium]
MIILDTNILSALMQTKSDAPVINWLNSVAVESIWITSITLFETRFGLALLPDSKRRNTLTTQFEQVVEIDLDSRVLLFDQDAANMAATLAANRKKAGNVVDMRDTFIAGIALARKAAIATRNTKHFQDLEVEVINPWEL